ncbi:DUF4189 domain-containing protein [Mycobacterium branderi]|nr:DUF4189 domain-containing protein [Mycobacterium branderi]
MLSFRLQAAIGACAAAVVAALTVAVAPAAHAARWGACAVPNDPNKVTAAICLKGSIENERGAAKYAADTCKYNTRDRQCHTVVTYTDCGAVALVGNQWGAGSGPTKQAAEQAALDNLQVPDGRIVTSACIPQN